MQKIILGCHIGLSKKNNYFYGAVQQALSYDANALMIYTGPPQSFNRVPTTQMSIKPGLNLLSQANIPFNRIVVHAPYVMNLATDNLTNQKLSKQLLLSEALRTQDFQAQYLVFHPGNYLNQTITVGINNLATILNEVIALTNNVIFTLETMPGKGSQIGKNFEELKSIINLIKDQTRIGVCLDTCHLNDAGYNVHEIDEIIQDFDQTIGLNYLKVIHLNDSKGAIFSKKDLHENIGYGTIGFKTLSAWAHHPKLINMIKILETPLVDGQPVYAQEIKMLREQKWVDYLHRNIYTK